MRPRGKTHQAQIDIPPEVEGMVVDCAPTAPMSSCFLVGVHSWVTERAWVCQTRGLRTHHQALGDSCRRAEWNDACDWLWHCPHHSHPVTWVNDIVSVIDQGTHKKIIWLLSLTLAGAQNSPAGLPLTCTLEEKWNTQWRKKSIHVSQGLQHLQVGRTEQFEISQVVGSNMS